MLKRPFFRLVSYFSFFVSLIAADRITKWLAMHYLSQGDINVAPGVTLSFALNRGVSCSMLKPTSPLGYWMLTGFITVMLILFMVYTVYEYRHNQMVIPELSIIAGGLGNLLDRLVLGGVIDFIDIHYAGWHWPTFNIADTCIVLGVISIIVRTWYEWITTSRNMR